MRKGLIYLEFFARWLFALSVDVGDMLQPQLCHRNTSTFFFCLFTFLCCTFALMLGGYHFIILQGIRFNGFESTDLQGLYTILTSICNSTVDCKIPRDQVPQVDRKPLVIIVNCW